MENSLNPAGLNLDFIALSEDPICPNTEQRGLLIQRYVKAISNACYDALANRH